MPNMPLDRATLLHRGLCIIQSRLTIAGEAGRMQQMSVLFTCGTTVEFVNTLFKAITYLSRTQHILTIENHCQTH